MGRMSGSFEPGAPATHFVGGKAGFWFLFGEDSEPGGRENGNFDLLAGEKVFEGSGSAVDGFEGAGTGFPNSVVGGFELATFGADTLAKKLAEGPPAGTSGSFLNNANP